MCALLETKLNKDTVDVFINKFFQGWKCFINLDAHEGGRILFLWRSDLFDVSVLVSSAHSVHCNIRIMGVPCPFLLSVVYSLHTIGNRKELWSQLMRVATASPWLVGGDFNTMFSMDAKLGGNPINYNDIVDGIEWLQNTFLEELRCLGPKYSWSNRQMGNNRIYSKFD